eukprot:gene2557-2931_t
MMDTTTTDNKKINVLLTGASGFVGSNAIRPLIESGLYNVFAFVRSSSKLPDTFKEYATNPSYRIIVGDFVDLESDSQEDVVGQLTTVMAENAIDTVVHLAAMMEFYPDRKEQMHKTNVTGTQNLISAALANSDNGFRRFVYISTTETVGGVSPPDQRLRSEHDVDVAPNYYYGQTKLDAEAVVRAATNDHGLDSIILRLPGVYGKNDDFTMYELIQAISWGLIFFIPSFATGAVMYTHVDDAVHAIMLGIKKKKKSTDDQFLAHTYNITPDKGMTFRDILVFVNEKLNRMKPRLVLPGIIVTPVISALGKIMYLFKKKKFLYQSNTLIRMSEDRLFSNERAKRELGFKPQYNTFKQGLNVTIVEYLENERISYYPVSPLFKNTCTQSKMLAIDTPTSLMCLMMVKTPPHQYGKKDDISDSSGDEDYRSSSKNFHKLFSTISRDVQEKDVLSCPLCRTETKLNANGIDGLPVNRDLNNICENIKSAFQLIPKFCDRNAHHKIIVVDGQSVDDFDVEAHVQQDDDFDPPIYLKFNMSKKQCQVKFREWIGSLWFAPSNLNANLSIRYIKPVYIPYWIFEADTTTSYSTMVSSGNTAIPQLGGSNLGKFDKTWTKKSSLFSNRDLLIQVQAWELTNIPDSSFIPDPKILPLAFISDETTSWRRSAEPRIKQKDRDIVEERIKSSISVGTTSKDLVVDTVITRIASQRVFLPVYFVKYVYNNETYSVIVNAQNSKIVGHRPYSGLSAMFRMFKPT